MAKLSPMDVATQHRYITGLLFILRMKRKWCDDDVTVRPSSPFISTAVGTPQRCYSLDYASLSPSPSIPLPPPTPLLAQLAEGITTQWITSLLPALLLHSFPLPPRSSPLPGATLSSRSTPLTPGSSPFFPGSSLLFPVPDSYQPR